MKDFDNAPVSYAVGNNGEIIRLNDDEVTSFDNIHVTASMINKNVILTIMNLINEYDVKKIVVNRQKLTYSKSELNHLDRLKSFIEKINNNYNKNMSIEFLEESSTYSLEEIKEVNERLQSQADVINRGYVVNFDGKTRPFSPLEKLFAIHNIVANNYYIKNENVSSDATRNLYSVLQKDRKGIVCVGYAKWFKTLADLVDPQHHNFKVDVVASFFPKKRKENLKYEKISNSNFYKNIYSKQERNFHASNMVVLKDEVYKIEGVFHNDSTFDSIRRNDDKISFLHFMWPFHGYVKSVDRFIPLTIFKPDLEQARNLRSLALVKTEDLKISPAYLEYLKYPKKKIFIKTEEKVYRLLSYQIRSSKTQNLEIGKEFSIKKDKDVFIEHDYSSWEYAVQKYIFENSSKFSDNICILDYAKNGGFLPNIDSLTYKDVKDLIHIILMNDLNESSYLINENFSIDQNNVFGNAKKLITLLNFIKVEIAVKTINYLKKINVLPNIQDLYKDDVDEILDYLTKENPSVSLKLLTDFFKTNDLEKYQENIDNIIIKNSKITIKQLEDIETKKDKKMFKKLIERDNTEEIMYDTMMLIKKNVYNYFKTLSTREQKSSNIDIELF